jgi:hypothetical protein
MAASAAQIAQVRRMVVEPTAVTYTDELIQGFIEAYPLLDVLGTDPFRIDYTTTPPTQIEQTGWIPTYDLNAAAAAIWEEKAGVFSQDFDFQADGASYSRSQAYEQAMKQARYYRARRALGTIQMVAVPRPQPSENEEYPG